MLELFLVALFSLGVAGGFFVFWVGLQSHLASWPLGVLAAVALETVIVVLAFRWASVQLDELTTGWDGPEMFSLSFLVGPLLWFISIAYIGNLISGTVIWVAAIHGRMERSRRAKRIRPRRFR